MSGTVFLFDLSEQEYRDQVAGNLWGVYLGGRALSVAPRAATSLASRPLPLFAYVMTADGTLAEALAVSPSLAGAFAGAGTGGLIVLMAAGNIPDGELPNSNAPVSAGSAASKGLARAIEHIDEVAHSLTARRRAAELAGLGDNSIPYVSTLGPQKGMVVGRQSPDGLRGWRMDYDPQKGYHVNWWDHTGGSKRKDWLYGAVKIKGGTWHDYIELLRHGFGN